MYSMLHASWKASFITKGNINFKTNLNISRQVNFTSSNFWLQGARVHPFIILLCSVNHSFYLIMYLIEKKYVHTEINWITTAVTKWRATNRALSFANCIWLTNYKAKLRLIGAKNNQFKMLYHLHEMLVTL